MDLVYFTETTTDSNGILNFTYNGSYSEKDFFVEEAGDSSPTVTLNSPSHESSTSNTTVTFNSRINDSMRIVVWASE